MKELDEQLDIAKKDLAETYSQKKDLEEKLRKQMALSLKDMLKGEGTDSLSQKHVKSNFTTINHDAQEESYTISKRELDKAPSSIVLSDVKDSSKLVTIQSHTTSKIDKNEKAPVTS